MEDLLSAVKTTKCSPGLITERYKKWVEDFGSLWSLFLYQQNEEIKWLL